MNKELLSRFFVSFGSAVLKQSHLCLSGIRASLQQACASLCKHALLKVEPGKTRVGKYAQACLKVSNSSLHKLAKEACTSLQQACKINL